MIMGIDPGMLEMTFVVLDDDGKFVCSSELLVRSYLADLIRPAFFDELMEALFPLWNDDVRFDVVGCEGVYVGENQRLAVQLGKVVGYIYAVAVVAGVPFVEIAPAAARKALTGNGAAADRRALQCAREYTGNNTLTIHEADALGVALAALEITGKYLEEEVEE